MRTIANSEAEVMVERAATRRHRSKQERRQIAEESLQAGASVAVVARQHGVNANQVLQWRKLLREGRLDINAVPAQLLPVRIANIAEEERPAHQQAGVIQIELGRMRVRVEGAVDPATLHTVLEQLGR